MTFFDEQGKQIQCQQWLKTYKPYYFLNGSTRGQRINSRNQTSPFVESQVCALLKQTTQLSKDDLILAVAWKIGAIDHHGSEAAQKIKYLYNWDTALRDRYRRDFSEGISYLSAKMPTILQQINQGDPQYLFDLHSTLDGFGPVYVLAILFFMTHGKYPIYDQFAHIAVEAIHRSLPPGSYIPYRPLQEWSDYQHFMNLLRPIGGACPREVGDSRMFISRPVDRALWVYGHFFTKPGTASANTSCGTHSSSPVRGTAQILSSTEHGKEAKMLNGITVRCRVTSMSQRYADGLTRCVLYVCNGFEQSVPRLEIGQQVEIILSTRIGDFRARLRAESSVSGRLYVCPDLRSTSDEKVTLARVLKDCGIKLGQEVEVSIKDAKWTMTANSNG